MILGLFRNRKKALVLGGGSARGLSNIGVLKVLEEKYGKRSLPFDLIVGTSIGSLIGAGYSLGMDSEGLEKMALKFKWPRIVDPCIFQTGLLKGDKLESIIRDIIGDRGFEQMRIPFALTTTDIENGEEITHTSGELVKLIRASCSWPGIFTAVEMDGRLLVDGGVRNSIPTKAAKELGGTFLLAVDPGFAIKKQKVDNVLKAFVQSFQIMGEELNHYQADQADLVIKPVLPGMDQFDFESVDTIIRKGEEAARDKIDIIDKKIRSIW